MVLDTANAAADACKQAMIEIKDKIRNLQYDQDKAAAARARAVIAHAASLRRIAQAHNDLLENRLWQVEAESDIAGLKNRNSSIMKRLDDEKNLLEEVRAEKNRKKEEGHVLRNEVAEEMKHVDDARRVEITEMTKDAAENRDRTVEELQNLKEAEEAKLELIHAANPNVVREFERRAAEMERLQRKVEASEAKVQTLSREIENVRSQWEPRLDDLVRKIDAAFAHNFEQISCSGEVRVHRDDDFDLWAIDIMVKFR